ncbi:hypothetical protein AB0M80_08265 [Amycolatopsis sp. NPDC051045]|uniref:phage tail tube protein n=1 Tax=Amycolatopsis sp. NPDC051045 TaxID=3156922 RepID=UPI0034477637
MPLRSMLASDWALDVDTAASGATAPQWTPVRGLSNFSESTDDNTEDDSTNDAPGWGADVITQRKWKVEAEGKRKRDTSASTYTPDPGQEFIRKAARKVGFSADVHVRWYRRDGSPDASEGYAQVSEFTKGGETTDLEPFNFTLLGQGEPLEIANPVTTPPAGGTAAAATTSGGK